MAKRKHNYDLNEVKRLLSETTKSYRDIQEETGCPYPNIVYHGRKIRGKQTKGEARTPITQPDHEEQTEQPASSTYLQQDSNAQPISLNISRQDIDLDSAEDEVRKMLKAARTLGLNKVNISLYK
ncbi:hypothetical protein [Thalassobacillus sp. CUG 92003]|uniref:hypothetical protein n=1 Tax=Thalassobacillus sp. CUG 92003 TaxID=2736641 RepID=UPI0015E770BD|nr:hypothetical protein [Thalassobacillus sp. CUG 92003]